MRCAFSQYWFKLIGRYTALVITLLISSTAIGSNLSILNLQTGQPLSLDARMQLCSDARELRSKLLSGGIHKIKTQCKNGAETVTVELNGDEIIYGITHRKDYESNLSMDLIEMLRSNQVAKYGQPDVETHKLPASFSGEVWQYGWGESCFIDPENERITAGKSGGACLVIDTDFTASKKLLIEYIELKDVEFDPGYRSSKEMMLELYSKAKGARVLDFSGGSKKKPKVEKERKGESEKSDAPKLTLSAQTSDSIRPELSCEKLYAKVKSKATGDTSVCEQPVPEVVTSQCPIPQSFTAQRPTSHIVLVLDASGSMAGKVGGQSKMRIAKNEIRNFVSDLQGDVPVGLVVYGHRGDNSQSGKAESCASHEWALPIGSSQMDVTAALESVQPTGWTPLGDTLTYLETQLSDMVKDGKDNLARPVVYVVSDGRETCGGDPVKAAKSLYDSGVRAAVNVIGFDVDSETRDQLKAISEAGGGQYFPAEDSAALRKQLQAAKDSEAAIIRYNYCVLLGVGKAEMAFHNAQVKASGCFVRETQKKWLYVIKKAIRDFSTEEEKACTATVNRLMYADYVDKQKWIVDTQKNLLKLRKQASAKAYEESAFGGTP